MKRIIFVLACVLLVQAALAQKDMLALNEQNKYVYYEVKEQPGLSVDTLQNRALYFLKKAYPANKVKQAQTSGNITGTGRFLILSGTTVVKHVDGEINYTFYIECKDQKYRYWLTDFVFTPYKIDRYGNSVPEQGIEVPLESASSKLDKKQIENYLNQTGAYCKLFGEKLKHYMLNISALPPQEVKKKVIVTKDW